MKHIKGGKEQEIGDSIHEQSGHMACSCHGERERENEIGGMQLSSLCHFLEPLVVRQCLVGWSEEGELKGHKNRQLIEDQLLGRNTKHISDSLKKERTERQAQHSQCSGHVMSLYNYFTSMSCLVSDLLMSVKNLAASKRQVPIESVRTKLCECGVIILNNRYVMVCLKVS